MMTDRNDPWKDIQPPDQTAEASARRVDLSLPWGLFWAVDADRNCLLILRHGKENRKSSRLPNLRGLRIDVHPLDEETDHLIIRLVDREQREIFHRLCLDIIEATSLAATEQQAIQYFLTRTWRWHRLLMGAPDGRLSDEEQKGLIGELGVLERHLMPALGLSEAIQSWVGPLGEPKDFEIGQICIEAKARRGTATPHVMISSEHQLDLSGVGILFLHVTEVTAAAEGMSDTVTITDIAGRLRSEIMSHDPAAFDLFDERLVAAGFEWDVDYSDKRWWIGPAHVFEVREGFPSITSSMILGGIDKVRYRLSLKDCESFRVDARDLTKAISRER